MDLNVMMREQAKMGLQTQLDAAVTNGDTETARKVAADIAKLEAATAPKAPPFNNDDIIAQLQKTEWYGVDPKKSAKAGEFGKTMDPKKFSTAEAFAAALVKAVEAEFAPPVSEKKEDEEPEEEAEEKEKPAARRKTDGPGESDNGGGTRRATSGPWTKISDAPGDIQKEIKRTADKFVSASAPKEQREKFIAKALESHYATHLRNKGKK